MVHFLGLASRYKYAVFLVVALSVAAVSILAAYVPAHRTSRIEPMAACENNSASGDGSAYRSLLTRLDRGLNR